MEWYESPDHYASKGDPYKFIWFVKGEWLTIILDYGDGSYDYRFKCRYDKIVSKNMIIWRDYDDYEDLNDSFGNYRLWTWERYPE